MALQEWKDVELLPPDMRIACITQKDAEALRREVEAVTASSNEAPSEKQMRQLLSAGSQSWDHLWYFIDTLAKRLRNVSDWSTMVKGLLLLHQLLRCGSHAVENDILELLDCSDAAKSVLNLTLISESFIAQQGHTAKHQTVFVRAYARYVLQRVRCARVVTLVSWARRPQVDATGNGESTQGMQSSSFGKAYWKDQNSETMMKQVHAFQELLEKLLHCQPTSQHWATCPMLVNALEFVLRDSFDLYSSLNYALMELVERFGQLSRDQAFDCLQIYRRAADLAEGLALLYHRFGELGVGRGVNFPTVAAMGESYLQSLQDSLTDDSTASRPPQNQPLAITDGKIMQPVIIPGTPQALEAARSAAISAAASQQFDDTWKALFTTDQYSAPSQPQQHPKAHAAQNPNVQTSWQSSQGTQVYAGNQQRAGWACGGQGTMVSQSSSSLVPNPTPLQPVVMAGGFDQLLLDSLYEAAQAQRRDYMGIVGGGATPSLTIHQFGADPFAASASIPPPPYVQMALRAQQQMGMLLQQKMMAQHAYYSSVWRGETPPNHQQLHNPLYNCRNVDNIGVQYGGVLVPYS